MTTSPSHRDNPTRGSTFSCCEGESISNSWFTLSSDAVVSAEQKGDVSSRAVHDVYIENFNPVTRHVRSFESIRKITKLIVKVGVAFAGFVAKIITCNLSRTNESDQLRLATALYNE